jgi:glycosyltransferase involved in cell wall biosynthesis
MAAHNRLLKKTGEYTGIVINGEFFCGNLSGIERVAYEIAKCLDGISKKDEIGIIIPKNAKNVPCFKNFRVINYEKDIASIPVWQQFILPGILRKMKAVPLDFGNSCSLFYPGISFLHDIYCEMFPDDFKTKREKHERFYFRILNRIIASRAKKIITVSYFSRDQIAKAYHIKAEKITVIYNGWYNFEHIKSDHSIFDDYPALSKPFYFSLGSLSKRKNIKWIVEYAARNPASLFVISGSSLNTFKVDELSGSVPPNVILPGYLDDSKVKALMTQCKAFIHPAYYEGFGLTPLEALSCGVPIIIAKAASLPEIYGNTAHYIDPFNTDVDLDELLKQPVDPPDEILKKYSYDTSARQLYEIIKEYSEKL